MIFITQLSADLIRASIRKKLRVKVDFIFDLLAWFG